jgi:AcrR family transcriptional regulator
MARPQTFDTDLVLQKAMCLFWEFGYSATSISELEKATGVSRISLYNAFESKEYLFLIILDMYHKVRIQGLKVLLEAGDLNSIVNVFRTMNAPQDDNLSVQYGCLMLNTLLEVNSISDRMRKSILDYRADVKREFVEVLSINQSLLSSGDIDSKAEFIISNTCGLALVHRLFGYSDQSCQLVDQMAHVVELWQK